jgi:hypothetical protein
MPRGKGIKYFISNILGYFDIEGASCTGVRVLNIL